MACVCKYMRFYIGPQKLSKDTKSHDLGSQLTYSEREIMFTELATL